MAAFVYLETPRGLTYRAEKVRQDYRKGSDN